MISAAGRKRRAADLTQVKPLEPLAAMLGGFVARGGALWACAPCAHSRGYAEDTLIDGVVVASASKTHELIEAGAATLSF